MIQTITYANGTPHDPNHTFAEMQASLKINNGNSKILGWGDPWTGLGSKPKKLLEFLLSDRKQPEYTLFHDAFDVMFLADPMEILEKMKEFFPEADIVFNAEINLFPEIENGEFLYPPTGRYRYLNAGFFIGKTQSIIDLLVSMKMDQYRADFYDEATNTWYNKHNNDQRWFLNEFPKKAVPMALDHHAHLCQTLFMEDEKNLRFADYELTNLLTRSNPLVVHLNGPAKEHPTGRQIKEHFSRIMTATGFKPEYQ